MNFFKNIEIARKYNVSIDTVANWITGSLEGKNDLEIYKRGQKNHILNTSLNTAILDALSNRSRKFRNRKFLKKISPPEVFYRIYSEKQIMDLILILESHKEIDMKFIYFGDGAKYWDDLYNRSVSHKGFSIQKILRRS